MRKAGLRGCCTLIVARDFIFVIFSYFLRIFVYLQMICIGNRALIIDKFIIGQKIKQLEKKRETWMIKSIRYLIL